MNTELILIKINLFSKVISNMPNNNALLKFVKLLRLSLP